MDARDTDDFTSRYDDLLDLYSEEIIRKVANDLGLETRDDINLCRNAVSNAGLAYLSEFDHFDTATSKKELTRKIKKTGNAAKKLADNLKDLLTEARAVTAVAREFRTNREYLFERLGGKSASMQYLAAIFKLEEEYSEPHLDQLSDLADAMAHILGQVSASSISDPISTRGNALNRWMQSMAYFLADSNQTAPNIGHYYKEFGSYKNSAVPAFHSLISLIDPSINERAVVTAIENATKAYLSDNRFEIMPALFMNMVSWVPLIETNRVLCSKQKLASYMGMPYEVMEGFWRSCEKPDDHESTEAFVTVAKKHLETKSGQKP